MADAPAPARRQGAAARGAGRGEQDLPPNYASPDEGGVMRDGADRMAHDTLTGKIKMTKHSSVAEYNRCVEKMLGE